MHSLSFIAAPSMAPGPPVTAAVLRTATEKHTHVVQTDSLELLRSNTAIAKVLHWTRCLASYIITAYVPTGVLTSP